MTGSITLKYILRCVLCITCVSGCYKFPPNARDPCQDKECPFGSRCRPSLDGRSAECVCPEKCATYGDSRGSRPVCGTDGRDYPNVCELRRSSCKEMRDIQIKYQGRCDPCEGVECPTSQVCQLDDGRNPLCRCNAICSPELRPVCGSDGKTYTNECNMRVEACRSRKIIRIIYTGECNAGANPCESLDCGPGEECDIDRFGIATCQCPPSCEPVMRPVCGSDGRTYHNDCELIRQGCLSKREVTLMYRGECGERGPCHNHECSFGAVCVIKAGYAVCECPSCTEEFEPVCGTDGISYTNLCKLKREGCEQKTHIDVSYDGLCNGCENKNCEFYAVCESDGKTEARCVCPHSCIKVESTICGTDGVTYLNECEMRVAACNKQQHVVIGSRGPCDLCQNVHCKHGARCENGRCICPTDCPDHYEAVCASDGITYSNECEMKKATCVHKHDLSVLFYGECGEVGSSGQELRSVGEGCTEKTCNFGSRCEYDAEGLPICVCNFDCPPTRKPVCGSDGKIHSNDCRIKEESCRQQMQIYILPITMCEADQMEAPCDGELPLVDPLTSQDYFCGEGHNSKRCPPSSYCHRTQSFAKCCRETCNCNLLGSVRDDCEQMTGRCVCKQGVKGLKCDVCPEGTVLGTDGCTDVSIAKPVTGSCTDLTCSFGASCKESEYADGLTSAQCVCEVQCSTAAEEETDNEEPICGSDGNTYGSECQMRLFSCRYQKEITTATTGPCKRGGPQKNSEVLSTPNPVRRSTIQRTAAADHLDTKSTREVLVDQPETFHLTTRPTLATPMEFEHSVQTPAFFGHSYMELPRLQAYTRLSLELEFQTFSHEGILLYNGQTTSGTGDFISLAIREGFVEFRYNLGNGPVVLRSPHKLHLGKYHRLVAKRYLREGLLTLDGKEDVAGRSQGSLKSLDLAENLFLGYVPAERKGIFENMAVNTGIVGCIRRLKIGKKEIDLRYPASKDIIRGKNIRECGKSPCSSMPCQNSGICEPLEGNDYHCICLPSFSGKFCDSVRNPCLNSSCSLGSTCVTHDLHGFICLCPPEKTGKFCEKSMEVEETFVPEFDGQSYLEFPVLTNVRHAFNIEMWFLTRSPDGTLLYNGQKNTGKGDFVAITLEKGHVFFRFDLGSVIPSVSSEDTVSLNNWHAVKASRLWKNGTLQIDDGEIAYGASVTSLTELNLEQNLYIGGVPNIASVNPEAQITSGLKGAIQRISINGEVWEDILSIATWSHGIRRYRGPPCGGPKHKSLNECLHGGVCIPRLNQATCRCPLHFMGTKCEKQVTKEDLEKPVAFDGDTFFSISNKESSPEGQRESNIEVTFRTSYSSGLLIWTHGGSSIRGGDYLALTLVDGRIQLSFNLGKQADKALHVVSEQRVDDSLWHTAFIERNMRMGTLIVDNGAPASNMSDPGATELNTDGVFWIGGCPYLPAGLSSSYYQGFRGCIERVVIDGDPLHLVLHGSGEVTFCEGS